MLNRTRTWQGLVLAVAPEEFRALFYDLDAPNGIEIGEVKIDQIAAEQVPLVTPGAVFLWRIVDGCANFHFDTNARLTEEKFESAINQRFRG